MKQIFEYEAENFTHNQIVELVKELEAKGIEVEYARSDAYFSDTLLMVVTCEDEVAKQIKSRIWELNSGLFCNMYTITESQLNGYLEE